MFIIYTGIMLYAVFNFRTKKENIIIEQPELTDKDGLYLDLDTLQYKSDTIEIYYETKVQNYRILPTPKRVELFAERISR